MHFKCPVNVEQQTEILITLFTLSFITGWHLSPVIYIKTNYELKQGPVKWVHANVEFKICTKYAQIMFSKIYKWIEYK